MPNLSEEEEEDYDSERYQSFGRQAAVIDFTCILLRYLVNIIICSALLIASLLIFFFGSPNSKTQDVEEWNNWHLIDPIFTFLFSIVTIASTLAVLKKSYYIVMDTTPNYVDLEALQKAFEGVRGVIDVHDLHVWDLKPGKTVVIAHVLARKDTEKEVLIGLSDIARQKKILYSTFQV